MVVDHCALRSRSQPQIHYEDCQNACTSTHRLCSCGLRMCGSSGVQAPGAASEGAVASEALGPGANVSGSSCGTWRAHVGRMSAGVRFVRSMAISTRPRSCYAAHRRTTPRIAVLVGCGSATALDVEGWVGSGAGHTSIG